MRSAFEAECDINGWCKNIVAPPALCSLPPLVSSTCLHWTFQERLGNATTPAGKELLGKMLDCMQQGMPMEGRPFYTSEGVLRSVVAWGHGRDHDSWCAARPAFDNHALSAPALWSREEAQAAADAWLRHGQDEHASIASFSRFSLDLLRFAAPPSLLAAAHSAAGDEVRHAVSAFKLAAYFQEAGADATQVVESQGVQVGPFPSGDSVQLAAHLDAFAARTLEEGCRGESAAVARLARTLEAVVEESPARAPLQELFEDEARHAALAWSTLRWAASRGARWAAVEAGQQPRPVTRRPEAAGSSEVRSEEAQDPSLTWGGRLPNLEAEEIGKVVDQAWVAPWVAALAARLPLPEVVVPTEATSQAVAAAVQRAARLVREEAAALHALLRLEAGDQDEGRSSSLGGRGAPAAAVL